VSATPNPKPELALNRSHPHSTVAAALNYFISFAAEGLTGKTNLAISTAYFDVDGYAELADSLDMVTQVKLLIGAEPYPPTSRPRNLDPTRGSVQQQKSEQLRFALDENEASIRWGRDLLEFTPQICHTIQRLLDWLKSGRVDVRRLERKFLHAKAFMVEQNSHGVIAGSSNFTRAGLTSNIELNLGSYSPSIVAQVADFFEELWEQAVPYDLAAVFEQAEPHPYLVYLRMLWERYKLELEEEELLQPSLTQFQRHGLMRAQRIMQKYGGVLIADEVGLGKTYIAGELIRQTIENKQRALVVAPAVLRDGMWNGFLQEMDFGRRSVQVWSYEEVTSKLLDAADNQLDFANEPNLEEIALVVADEAHYLRNPSTKRAMAFNGLLGAGGGNKKLALLTATPVNNTLWDLFVLLDNILRAGGRGDAALSELGILSLRERFRLAEAMDVEALNPSHLFDVIDELAVRRMRQFIKKHYRDDTFRTGSRELKISFPKPNVEALHYDIDSLLPGFFEQFSVALNVDGNLNSLENSKVLTLARYMPSRYLKKAGERHYEVVLSGLMRSLLLKRFESSPHAFAKSCERMVLSNRKFLEFLGEGKVVSKKLLAELVDSSSDDAEEVLADLQEGTLFSEDITEAHQYDETTLRQHIERDNKILRGFAERAGGVTPENDPTLHEVVGCLEVIVRRADQAVRVKDKPAFEDSARDRRKVLIFSYFADTVEWIYKHLKAKVSEPDSPLACYRDRIAKLTGGESPGAKGRVLMGFAPKTATHGTSSEDLYDIVVTTDVLAEGVNLQQAQHIINYDLPWNPMRLVQRHGRIDRIGSPHKEVFLHCIMPDTRLEELLELEKKLRLKIGQANATMGIGKTLPGQEKSIEVNFADTQEELEKISQGNAELFENAGAGATALSGEEFRQELREAIADGKRTQIEDLPWRLGTGMAVARASHSTSRVSNGPELERGFVFCAKVGDSPNVQYRFVPLDVVQNSEGNEVAKHSNSTELDEIRSETLECLFLARPQTGWSAEAIPQNLNQNPSHPVFKAWRLARQHIVQEWNKLADKKTVEPEVPRKLRDAGQLLREHPPPGKDRETIDNAIRTVEAPLLDTGKRAISKIMREAGEDKVKAAAQILATIDELGLKPFEAPLPNPEITTKDVHLVCWLALV